MKISGISRLLVVAAIVAGASTLAHAHSKDERGLMAYLKVKVGKETDFLNAAKNVIDKSRKEPGCLIYILHESERDPQQFLFYELYKSEAGLQAHRSSKHVVDFLNTVKPILIPGGFILEEYEVK